MVVIWLLLILLSSGSNVCGPFGYRQIWPLQENLPGFTSSIYDYIWKIVIFYPGGPYADNFLPRLLVPIVATGSLTVRIDGDDGRTSDLDMNSRYHYFGQPHMAQYQRSRSTGSIVYRSNSMTSCAQDWYYFFYLSQLRLLTEISKCFRVYGQNVSYRNFESNASCRRNVFCSLLIRAEEHPQKMYWYHAGIRICWDELAVTPSPRL